MPIRFDHLVVAARNLEEGAAWLESRLGVPMEPGGKHDLMGTHNRLLSLGAGRFLEVIAIDPAAPPPGRARWFELDTPEMQARLEREPALVTWVARTDDIGAAVDASAGGRAEILDLARGEFRWRIGVPRSGSLALAGASPTMIQWSTRHPSDVLPDSACRLEKLVLRGPGVATMLAGLHRAGLDPGEPIEARAEGRGLGARVRTPNGIVDL